MKSKFKKYYIFHHVIILKRFVIPRIKYLHNIKHFYIYKISFKYYLNKHHKIAKIKELQQRPINKASIKRLGQLMLAFMNR